MGRPAPTRAGVGASGPTGGRAGVCACGRTRGLSARHPVPFGSPLEAIERPIGLQALLPRRSRRVNPRQRGIAYGKVVVYRCKQGWLSARSPLHPLRAPHSARKPQGLKHCSRQDYEGFHFRRQTIGSRQANHRQSRGLRLRARWGLCLPKPTISAARAAVRFISHLRQRPDADAPTTVKPPPQALSCSGGFSSPCGENRLIYLMMFVPI